MNPRKRRRTFTPKQKAAIGQVVVDNWGANFQTWNLSADARMGFQRGPNQPVVFVTITPGGAVVYG